MNKNNFKHLYIIIIFMLLVLVSTSCSKVKGYEDIKKITYPEILNQKGNVDGTYYVVIYSTTCTFCEELEQYVVEYCNFINKKNSCSNNEYPPLYVLNLDATKDNSDIKATSDSDYTNFTGTDDYTKIKFSSGPALITVTNGVVEKLISSKVTNTPKTDIKNLLKNTMN